MAQPRYDPEFSRGHFNQHTRNVGSMRVGDEEWSIDGFGWRDHSWGARYWQVIYAYRLLLANFGEDSGFMLDGRAGGYPSRAGFPTPTGSRGRGAW